MGADRILYATEYGGLSWPEDASVAALGAVAGPGWADLGMAGLAVMQTSARQSTAWSAMGFPTKPDWPGGDAAIVTLPSARALGESWIAMASAHLPAGALIVVDGDKSCGVESILKAVKKRVPVLGQVSKAHGKVFWFQNTPAFADWTAQPKLAALGFHTVPGVFSADGPDPGSKLLLEAVPDSLSGVVVDLGAGWGYLAAGLLRRAGVQRVHLVEDDHSALDCAQANVHDARAQFHWADATEWTWPEMADAVVMNPPFHTGKKGDPGLGRSFIRQAALMLKPAGTLWMVANRHLPYEAELAEQFRKVTELPGSAGYKLFQASHPQRGRRPGR